MRPVAQATGHIAYLPCGGYYPMYLIPSTRRVVYYAVPVHAKYRHVVMYTHRQNDTCVTLFAGAPVIL